MLNLEGTPYQLDPEASEQIADRLRTIEERESWLVRDQRKPGEGDGFAEVIFSNRSNMSYDDIRD